MTAPVLINNETGEVASEMVWGKVALHIPENTSFEDWNRLGETIQQMEKSVMWWIGDWLRFGESKYGEMYSQAVDVTGYAKGTLQNAKYVADRYSESSLRSELLTFEHHKIVASLPDDLRYQLLQQAERDNLSVRDFRQLVKEGGNDPFVSHNGGNNEWYTPEQFIEAARRVLGGIDVDPASSEIANKVVKAEIFFTEEDDGLSQDWPEGRYWMNPPYAQPLMGEFANKYAVHMHAGGSSGIVLVNNATETNWFQQIAGVSSVICFPKGRTKFLDPEGNPGAPLQGQAILYSGDDAQWFAEVFEEFGLVVVRSG